MRQGHPLEQVISYHMFHSRWVNGEFKAKTVAESYKNESHGQVCKLTKIIH